MKRMKWPDSLRALGSSMPPSRNSTSRLLPSVGASGILRATILFVARRSIKGTEPTEFVEWVGNFSYEPVYAGDYIRGFGRVHGAYFPATHRAGARMPCGTFHIEVRLSKP